MPVKVTLGAQFERSGEKAIFRQSDSRDFGDVAVIDAREARFDRPRLTVRPGAYDVRPTPREVLKEQGGMEECVVHVRGKKSLLDGSLRGMVLERAQDRMNYRREDDAAHPCAFRQIDHLGSDGACVLDKCRSDIKDRVHSVNYGSHVFVIRKITDDDIRRPGPQDGVFLLRSLDESTDNDTALRQLWHQKACERVGSSDGKNAA